MKEIKFRAWDKDSKQMIKVNEIDFFNEVVGLVINLSTTNKEKVAKKLEVNIEEIEIELNIGKKFKDVELMQYIGLKDKNEVEIYEGDIVEIDTGAIGEVVFNDECAYFSIETKTGIFLFEDIPLEAIKIIGNIFEGEYK